MDWINHYGKCMNNSCPLCCQIYNGNIEDENSTCENCSCMRWQHEILGVTVNGVTTILVPHHSASSTHRTNTPSSTTSTIITPSVVRRFPDASVSSSAQKSSTSTPHSSSAFVPNDRFGSSYRAQEFERMNNKELNKLEASSIFRGTAAKTLTSGILNRPMDLTNVLKRKRGAGAYGNSNKATAATSTTTVTTKTPGKKVVSPPKLSIFFLRQGRRAPAMHSDRLELQRSHQFFDDFIYFDGDVSISQGRFEEYFFGIEEAPLRELLLKKKYRFFLQVGIKYPKETQYSCYKFPDAEVWISLAKDSRKCPLICAPYEESPLDKTSWRGGLDDIQQYDDDFEENRNASK